VADVVVQGGRKLEARVELDPVALASRNLDAATVVEGIRNASALESARIVGGESAALSHPGGRRPRDLARSIPS